MPDHSHIVSSFDLELRGLDEMIAKMGGLTEKLLRNALKALEKKDADHASLTVRDDKKIDRFDEDIEDLAIRLIARRQPMAQDLRQIMGAIRISGELERIGDLGKNIAKRTIVLADTTSPRPLNRGLQQMGKLALGQLRDVLAAYARRDAALADDVWARDDEIDSTFNSLFRELLTYMMEDPRYIGLCTHLLFCAKNIERIGDHTTNIAEIVHFLVVGEVLDEKRPKSDHTSSTRVDTQGDEASFEVIKPGKK